jgi:putative ABC transport system permease protein
VAIVNTTFAERFFPGRSPIGATYRVPQGDAPGPTFTVVGVVRDAKYRTLSEKTVPTAFYPIDQDPSYEMGVSFAVKTSGPVTGLAPAITKAITDVVPNATLRFMPLSQQVAETLTRPRLMATLAGFFGGLALLLAVIGLYGIMSYNVARRRREIGVRLALGAQPRRVLTTVLSEVGGILAVGLGLGIAGAVASTRLLTTFLFGLTPTDAATLGGAVLLLGATALLAGYLPARRASRVDPMLTIREE